MPCLLLQAKGQLGYVAATNAHSLATQLDQSCKRVLESASGSTEGDEQSGSTSDQSMAYSAIANLLEDLCAEVESLIPAVSALSQQFRSQINGR